MVNLLNFFIFVQGNICSSCRKKFQNFFSNISLWSQMNEKTNTHKIIVTKTKNIFNSPRIKNCIFLNQIFNLKCIFFPYVNLTSN